MSWIERLCASSPAVVSYLFCGVILGVCGALDNRYLDWVLWTYRPIVVVFVLPAFILLLLYVSAFLIYMFRIRQYLLSSVYTTDFYFASLRLLAAFWDIQGRIFHGYEVIGMEKLASGSPCLITYYHGTIPLDAYYFIARHILLTGRSPIPVVDNFLFRMPGFSNVLELIRATPGTVESCVRMLGHGHAVIISPGGVREALFADEYYSTLWGRRVGFAKIAINAGVPIYPMFCENCRDAVRVVQYGKYWFQRLYDITRLPFVLMYGYFPVKMRTYIGDPIYPEENQSPEELADKVRNSVESLIRQHQILPGNIFRGLLQRFPPIDRWLRNRYVTNSVASNRSR